MENELQTKIINYLVASGFEVIKLISANKSGWSDLVACSPSGKFWSIEVKDAGEVVVAGSLQDKKLKRLQRNNAVAFWTNNYADFKYKFTVYNTD